MKSKLKLFRKRRPPLSAGPGEIADPSGLPPPRLHAISYSAGTFEERALESPGPAAELLREGHVLWLDVQGLGGPATLREIGNLFGLHPLAMADVVNSPQRPKAESYGEYVLLITRMPEPESAPAVRVEQVSIFLGPGWVVSFQERHGDCLDGLRGRLRANAGLVRKQDAGYLAYSIVDAVIDAYYPVLEGMGDTLSQLEDEAIERPRRSVLHRTNAVRNELLLLRRILWPQREALNALIRDAHPLVSEVTKLHLRDAQDHCVQLSELVESYREIVSGIANAYLSSVSNRLNEVMKVLTILASIFIPLTFIVGVYGMNFDYMPELHYKYAYPAVWLAMAAAAAGMLTFFWRKGWLGSGRGEDE